VIKKTDDSPPNTEATRTFSTFSPSANTGKGFDAVSTENVASALRTVGAVVLSVILAVAVDAAFVPLKAVLLTQSSEPFLGVAVTFTVVPTGMLVAVSVAVTGFAVDAGRVMSGEVNNPPAADGTATPPTAVIESVGSGDRLTTPGVDTVTAGFVDPEKLNVLLSKRIRPGLPT
jgi:hypothetical protein